jgi:hypothetical protein
MPRPLVLVLAILFTSSVPGAASALDTFPNEASVPRSARAHRPGLGAPERTQDETLWILDADFSNLTGDSTGWLSSTGG